jgi:hypothetical protein
VRCQCVGPTIPDPLSGIKITAAYLRAAQAYILISMPTDTSTILGVFHAIMALLGEKPGELYM